MSHLWAHPATFFLTCNLCVSLGGLPTGLSLETPGSAINLRAEFVEGAPLPRVGLRVKGREKAEAAPTVPPPHLRFTSDPPGDLSTVARGWEAAPSHGQPPFMLSSQKHAAHQVRPTTPGSECSGVNEQSSPEGQYKALSPKTRAAASEAFPLRLLP